MTFPTPMPDPADYADTDPTEPEENRPVATPGYIQLSIVAFWLSIAALALDALSFLPLLLPKSSAQGMAALATPTYIITFLINAVVLNALPIALLASLIMVLIGVRRAYQKKIARRRAATLTITLLHVGLVLVAIVFAWGIFHSGNFT